MDLNAPGFFFTNKVCYCLSQFICDTLAANLYIFGTLVLAFKLSMKWESARTYPEYYGTLSENFKWGQLIGVEINLETTVNSFNAIDPDSSSKKNIVAKRPFALEDNAVNFLYREK